MKRLHSITGLLMLLTLAGCEVAAKPDQRASETVTWNVVATSSGDRKISAIKAIRELTSLGLKDAKDLADNVPSVIVSGVSKAEALRRAQRETMQRPEFAHPFYWSPFLLISNWL